MSTKKGAFSGIRIVETKPDPSPPQRRKSSDFVQDLDVGEDYSNPYIKRHKGDASNSEEINNLCEKSIKAFMSGNIEKFKELSKELLYAKSKQAVIHIDDSLQPDLHRVFLEIIFDGKKNLNDLLELEQDLENEEMLEPERKAKLVEKSDIRGDFIKEKEESAAKFRDEITIRQFKKDQQADESEEGKFVDTEKSREKALEKHVKKQFVHKMKVLAKCNLCFYNKEVNKDLIVSESDFIYVSVPSGKAICEDQISIIPKEHISAMNTLEEDLYEEVRKYIQSIVRYFGNQKKAVVFIETVVDIEKVDHTQIECIPIDGELIEDCKMYFHKALSDSDVKWSQHKKIISTVEKRGAIIKVIPEGFSYIHIDFEGRGGYAHVIEEPKKFQYNMASEVIGGVLGLDKIEIKMMETRPIAQKLEMAKKIKADFKNYDWTKGTND